ncbi:MAG: hypothetical protein P1V35_14165, partial [Planctomycetota bacterium]|nr:hypothetical protein [Planctomycetota bacterium]
FSRESLTRIDFMEGLWVWHEHPADRPGAALALGEEPVSQLRWTTRNQVGQWLEEYTVQFPLRIADLIEVDAGHVIVLKETIDGETILESWLLDPPYGPAGGAASWFTGGGAEGAFVPVGTKHWKGPHKNPNPELNARCTEVCRGDFGGSPEAVGAWDGGRFLFLLTRNRRTQYTVLHQLDLQGGVKHSVLETSDNQRMLAACTDVSTRATRDAGLFSVHATGVGVLKDSEGNVIEQYPHELLLSGSVETGVPKGAASLPGPTWHELRLRKAQIAQ